MTEALALYRNEKFIKNKFRIIKSTKQKKYTKEEGRIPVQPLRSLEDIRRAKNYFLNRPERYHGQNVRDYTIFIFGINLARRCGDLLHLRFHNVLDTNKNIKNKFSIREQKTGKSAILIITPVLKEALELYLKTFDDINLSNPLFPSRNKDTYGNHKPMTVQNFYKKMRKLQEELEISEPLGTHSMRKTFAYMALKNNPQNSNVMAAISKALNHSSETVTSRYIGTFQEEIDDLFMSNQL